MTWAHGALLCLVVATPAVSASARVAGLNPRVASAARKLQDLASGLYAYGDGEYGFGDGDGGDGVGGGSGVDGVVANGDTGVIETSSDTPDNGYSMSLETGRMYFYQAQSPTVQGAEGWKYELDTLLGMSYFFYEVNRAGPLPDDTRPPWRGDTLMHDGASLDGDLQGGYFDAGDHNKFILPQAFAVARLNWLLHAFKDTLQATYFDGKDNYAWAREAAKWGADFLVKGTKADEVILHIGDIAADHDFIGRAEFYPDIDRNIQWCPAGQCTDIAAEIAAALAHAAVAFEDNAELSARYWEKAKEAYAQSGAETGSFVASSSTAQGAFLAGYYASTSPKSHTFFAAASMALACQALPACDAAEADRYLAAALWIGEEEEDSGGKWWWPAPGWDNAWWDAAILMLTLGEPGSTDGVFGDGHFRGALRDFVGRWTQGDAPINVSPEGQRFIGDLKWGSNRNALNGAAIVLLWATLPADMRSGTTTVFAAQCTGVKQIHYVAGDNEKGSYIGGFADTSPVRPHHRNSACTPEEHLETEAVETEQYCLRYFYDVVDPSGGCPAEGGAQSDGTCFPEANRPNPYVLYGALIGGPKTATDAGDEARMPYSDEGYNDWRTDWIANEVTLDYNAHYTMALSLAMQLPASFWEQAEREGCEGENNDLELMFTAGLSRTPPLVGASDTEAFDFFATGFGFARTLPDNWMDVVP